MNTTTDNEKRQSESTKSEKLSRAEIRRQEKSAAKSMKSEKKNNAKKNNAKKQALLQRNEDALQKADEILKNLKAQTWRTLETNGKFSKNDKLSFISDDMLIVGCDIGLSLIHIS